MEQKRLFRLAVEAGLVTFQHVAGQGWRLTIRCRRGDEPWDEVRGTSYERLTTVELLDVISAELDGAL